MAQVDAVLEAAREGLERVGPYEARRRAANGSLLVDIRPEALRRRDGEIPDAIVIDRNVLEWRLDPTSAHAVPEVRDAVPEIIVVCDEGYASSLAAASLRRLGVPATDLADGFQAWRGAGLPIQVTVSESR